MFLCTDCGTDIYWIDGFACGGCRKELATKEAAAEDALKEAALIAEAEVLQQKEAAEPGTRVCSKCGTQFTTKFAGSTPVCPSCFHSEWTKSDRKRTGRKNRRRHD